MMVIFVVIRLREQLHKNVAVFEGFEPSHQALLWDVRPTLLGLTSHGGDDGIRTHDPLLAGQVLSQLSYTPIINAFTPLLGFAFSPFCELNSLVGPSGLEPPTSCLSGTRSNLLSYEPMWLVWLFTLGILTLEKRIAPLFL